MNDRVNQTWLRPLNYNPLPPLLENDNNCIQLKVHADLFDEEVDFESCWASKEVLKLIKKQQMEGYWIYPQARENTNRDNLNQYQTYRNFAKLVDMYSLDRSHAVIKKTAEYFFSVQTAQGDFRGIYDKQYTPNYTAGIAEMLIKAGYTDDVRIIRALDWLVKYRQTDGGWALPFRTRNHNIDVTYNYHETIEPDINQPSSYMVTSVVLRAFSIHPLFRERPEVKEAGELVSTYIFKRDKYPDRQDKKYWTQFVYPFCYSDLISVLDSLSLLGFSPQEPTIKKGLQWLIDEQLESGLWDLRISAGQDKETLQLYLDLAICKIFKQFYSTR
ncbi:hypothetical protein [Lacticigenium naphthae]|uniref:hypothetical protein n=1 Tax=Lacticigenium naphthae TaxID=515351 RepID=UPI000403A889|nr:hypothetical protein [Lacticigenium naphthae]